MRLAGNLLLTVSLTLGVLAAATAYQLPLDLPDERLLGQTLTAPAGKTVRPDRKDAPLVGKGQELTPARLQWLRESGVESVQVRDFQPDLWPGKWVFGLAVLGLLGGAVLVRRAAKGRLAATEGREAELPEQALAAITAAVDGLRRELQAPGPSQGASGLILERVGELQRTHMPAFAEARPLLVARLGLRGYAGLMDRYAAAERQINRAWSSAADGVYDEAVACLDRASELLEETAARLAQSAG